MAIDLTQIEKGLASKEVMLLYNQNHLFLASKSNRLFNDIEVKHNIKANLLPFPWLLLVTLIEIGIGSILLFSSLFILVMAIKTNLSLNLINIIVCVFHIVLSYITFSVAKSILKKPTSLLRFVFKKEIESVLYEDLINDFDLTFTDVTSIEYEHDDTIITYLYTDKDRRKYKRTYTTKTSVNSKIAPRMVVIYNELTSTII
jgi:hypothetical protein